MQERLASQGAAFLLSPNLSGYTYEGFHHQDQLQGSSQPETEGRMNHISLPGTTAASEAPHTGPNRLEAAFNGQVCCLRCCHITWSCPGFAYTDSVSEGYLSVTCHLYCLQAGWHFGFHLKQINSLSREENSLLRVRPGCKKAPPLQVVWQSLAVEAANPEREQLPEGT